MEIVEKRSEKEGVRNIVSIKVPLVNYVFLTEAWSCDRTAGGMELMP
jgi:hypothetical protein